MNNNTVTVAAVRLAKAKDGKEFVALDLIQIQPVKSKTSGKEYLGTVKASITSSLSEEIAKTLIGSKLPGTIVRQELPEAEYRNWVNPSTGEEMVIKHQNVWVSKA